MSEIELSEVVVLRRIAAVSARINAGQQLSDTLQAVADGVVEALGFGVAAMNFRLPSGDFEVVSVTGWDDARETLLGQIIDGQTMHRILDRAQRWGALRFAPHEQGVDLSVGWSPDLPVLDHADAWHPDDMLLAPLHSASGTLVGVLSVDAPPGLLRPGPMLRELLELFAVQAGIAIDNARLTEALHRERTELRHEQTRLRASEAAFRFAFAGSVSGMAMVSLDLADLGRVARVNDALCLMLGVDETELLASTWQELLHDGHPDETRELLRDFAEGRRASLRSEQLLRRGDRAPVWAAVTASIIAGDTVSKPFLLLHAEDVSERRTRESILAHQAAHDPLTGLMNRRGLLELLTGAVDRAHRTGRNGALLFCDLNRFKQVNDTFGHVVGDRVLCEVAERLSAVIRASDTVGRLGGDEFVVVAEDLDATGVAGLLARIRASVAEPSAVAEVSIGVSVGHIVIDGSEPDSAALLVRADEAMYADKRSALRR